MQSHIRGQYGYLICFHKPEDVQLIDAAILEGKLNIDKIGDRIYLGFFYEVDQEIYQAWKIHFGISGEVVWIRQNDYKVTP